MIRCILVTISVKFITFIRIYHQLSLSLEVFFNLRINKDQQKSKTFQDLTFIASLDVLHSYQEKMNYICNSINLNIIYKI